MEARAENLIRTEYSEVMQKAYIDYAMSVIIARALPDVRDGLKPVQRRTLYDMHELGIRYDRPYRKCARIVGDTMGKYHPHGDSSIYESLVVMAQDFKKGLPLVDGHGNFGSIEGDGAAAMRYTEARLQKITQEAYLADLDKDVVDFVPNFDETEKEPEVLPVKVPNILINGAEGIAVGMATSIPPHNFSEVIDGVKAYMKNPDINTEQMMEYIKGPDFPTGGIVTNKDDLLSIYSTGSGKIKVRGKVEIEKLEDTFSVNMLAVADGRPETMGIVPMIRHHVNFQYEIATRKYKTLLAKELEKKEVQEGLIKACDVIDLIIEILRGSKNIKDAKACLVHGKTDAIKFRSEESKQLAAQLQFTEKQATAILEMRLYKLIGLEIEALLKEHDKTLKNIASYEEILGSRTAMAKVIIKELDAFKKEYAKERKTVIDNIEAAVVEEKKIEEMDVVFLMDRFGYARIVDVPTYERNKEAADSENKCVVLCRNTDKICVFTDTGKMHSIKVLDLPFGKFRDKGQPIDNLSNYDSSQENIVYLMNLQAMTGKEIFFGTKNGMCKVVDGSEFDVAKRTIAATKLTEGDMLLTVRVLEGEESLILRSDKEYFLRLEASEIPQKKKGAVGVRGMRLAAREQMQEIYVLPPDGEEVVTVKEKEVALHRLHIGKRDTRGVKK